MNSKVNQMNPQRFALGGRPPFPQRMPGGGQYHRPPLQGPAQFPGPPPGGQELRPMFQQHQNARLQGQYSQWREPQNFQPRGRFQGPGPDVMNTTPPRGLPRPSHGVSTTPPRGPAGPPGPGLRRTTPPLRGPPSQDMNTGPPRGPHGFPSSLDNRPTQETWFQPSNVIGQQPHSLERPGSGEASADNTLPTRFDPSFQPPPQMSQHLPPPNIPPPPPTRPPVPPNFSIPPPSVIPQHVMSEPKPPEISHGPREQKEEVTQKDQDRQWIERFLWNKKRKLKTKTAAPVMSIPRARMLLKEALELLQQLKEGKANLEDSLNLPHDVWLEKVQSLCSVKKRLGAVQEELSEKASSSLKRKLDSVRKKRDRNKRRKQEEAMEEEEARRRREEKHREIDAWQHKIREKYLASKREKELKKTADSVLSEVRRKLAETNRWLDLMKAVTKLRAVRKDSMERKGLYTPKEADDTFNEKIANLVDMLKQQQKTYEAEQKTLQVMLETEHEESLEKERELLKLQQEAKQKREEVRLKTYLFGSRGAPDVSDPIYPFWQYYTSAEHSLEALVQIRHEWDTYLVPTGTPGGSRLPVGWVQPEEPSSDIWATCLPS